MHFLRQKANKHTKNAKKIIKSSSSPVGLVLTVLAILDVLKMRNTFQKSWINSNNINNSLANRVFFLESWGGFVGCWKPDFVIIIMAADNVDTFWAKSEEKEAV